MGQHNFELSTELEKLKSNASMHWFHWTVVFLSLLLTLFAWYYAESQKQTRIRNRFDRDANQTLDLVRERMEKYEDGLWAGVAMLRSFGDVDFNEWQSFADGIDIENKYPGINGIGVIHEVDGDNVETYLERQQNLRPDFKIHPKHSESEHFPISYIIPVEGNDAAVGLDLAFEANRYTAIKKARETGKAQITGPIILVQESETTPGFLFYAPSFYHSNQVRSNSPTTAKATTNVPFSGLVYAPFVVSKLMRGVLEKERRQVGIRLVDDGEVLYDEHVVSEADFDPNPIFARRTTVALYGRQWEFDFRSTNSFRKSAADIQPLTILISGILIDILLLSLFWSMSRASRKALKYADSLADAKLNLQKNQAALERSNSDLKQFAYIASHDLQEPLRAVAGFCNLLELKYAKHLDDQALGYISKSVDGAKRMQALINDLLYFSSVSNSELDIETVDLNHCIDLACNELHTSIMEAEAKVDADVLPKIQGIQQLMVQLFQNLIGNSIKYRTKEAPIIHIAGEETDDHWEIRFSDNGIGIPEQYREQIFSIFKRLHNRTEKPGTGIGLAICKRVVERHQGTISIEASSMEGTMFRIRIPKK